MGTTNDKKKAKDEDGIPTTVIVDTKGNDRTTIHQLENHSPKTQTTSKEKGNERTMAKENNEVVKAKVKAVVQENRIKEHGPTHPRKKVKQQTTANVSTFNHRRMKVMMKPPSSSPTT